MSQCSVRRENRNLRSANPQTNRRDGRHQRIARRPGSHSAGYTLGTWTRNRRDPQPIRRPEQTPPAGQADEGGRLGRRAASGPLAMRRLRQRRRPGAHHLHRRVERRERAALQRAAGRAGRLRDPPPGTHLPARARPLPAVSDPPGRAGDRDPPRGLRDRRLRQPLPRLRAAAGSGGGRRLHRRPRRLARHAPARAGRGADVGLAPPLHGARRPRGRRVRLHLREPRRRGRRHPAPPPRPDLRLPVPASRARARARGRRAPGRLRALRGSWSGELRRRQPDPATRTRASSPMSPTPPAGPTKRIVAMRAHRPSLLDCEPAELRLLAAALQSLSAATTPCSSGPSPT